MARRAGRVDTVARHVGGAGVTTTVIALAGIGHRHRGVPPAARVGSAARVSPRRVPLANAFWVDAFYDRVLVRPIRALASAMLTTEDRGVDAAGEAVGVAARGTGGLLRRLQTGNAQAYLSGLVLAVLAIVISVSAAAR